MDTLRERYTAQRLEEQRLIRKELILRENFDKQTVSKAVQVIKQLNSIKWPAELNSLKNATKNAVDELKRVIAGQGRKKGILDTVIGLFKSGKENPFLDVVAYSSALYSFFETMGKLVDALHIEGDKENMTVGQIVADSDSDMDEQMFLNIVKKGLKPAGAMAKVQTNWVKKYLNNDVEQVAKDIVNMSPSQLQDFSQHILQAISGTKEVSDKVAKAESEATGSMQAPGKETQPTSHAEPTAQSTGTQETTPNTVKPGHQNGEAAKKIDLEAAAKNLQPALAKLGVNNTQELLKALDDAGYLKSPE